MDTLCHEIVLSAIGFGIGLMFCYFFWCKPKRGSGDDC